MTAVRLRRHFVEKLWGRRDLGNGFGAVPDGRSPVGEVWLQNPAAAAGDLLIKYLFTSERLSIQVHPDDAAAHALGLPSGKDEAWIVLDAAPEAMIGLGLRQSLSRAELRQAALDGTLTDLVVWRPVKAGDIFYSPAGTIHAIGGGLTLVEVQQNVDVTYRLYDYGRPRELHLEQAVAVARAEPFAPTRSTFRLNERRQVVASGPAFIIERWNGPYSGAVAAGERAVSLVCLGGSGTLDGEQLEPGNAWLVEGQSDLSLDEDADLLVTYSRDQIRENLAS